MDLQHHKPVNQLTSYEDTSYGYDDNGNTTSKTIAGITTAYEYNHVNRLTTVKDNNNAIIANYYYDPFGRRLYKNVDGNKTYYMYAEEGLVAELDYQGNLIQSYAYQPQSAYGTKPLMTKTPAGYAYYQLDYLGTPQQLINKLGAVVWKAKSSSFGYMFLETNLITNNLRFPGQYYDEETGLHYNYFRYYDPSTGPTCTHWIESCRSRRTSYFKLEYYN